MKFAEKISVFAQSPAVPLIAAAALLAAPAPVAAQDFSFLGMTIFMTNDELGDGDDRWQTAGATASWMFGPKGLTELPDSFGTLWELRNQFQIITPDNFLFATPTDRRAAGVITTTIRTHFEIAGLEANVGLGAGFIGPSTGMLDVQKWFHGLFDFAVPPPSVVAAQIPNSIYLTASAEAARRVALTDTLTLRPFVEIQTGVETFGRIGADLFFGTGFDFGVLSRDATTGIPFQTLEGVTPPGVSLMVGADVAKVTHSALLPASMGYVLSPWRTRVRGGVLVQGRHVSLFTGASWLGPEFTAQPTGQIVGGVQIQLRF